MRILRNSWMREIDRDAIERGGIPSLVLMENAAHACAACFADAFPRSEFPTCLVLAGKGNNGGDGLAIARLLRERGYDVRALLLYRPEELSPDAKANYDRLLQAGLSPEPVTSAEQLRAVLASGRPGAAFLVDAVFGTGLDRPLSSGRIAAMLEEINASGIPVAAVDIPSGLGEGFAPGDGVHLRARLTAALHALKWAHFNPDGNPDCGRLRVLDIGIPRDLEDRDEHYIQLTEPADFRALLARRRPVAHKGDFGHALVVAGSALKPGASILASYAALRSGAGLCTAAVPPRNRDLAVLAHPEVMTLPFRKPEEIAGRLDEFTCVLAGPGMGATPHTRGMVSLLLRKTEAPLILDADALNVLKGRTAMLRRPGGPLVLTPHPGEFSRLCAKAAGDVQRDRLGLAREFAMEHGVFLVLKGHHTLTVTPEGRVWVNPTGNAGMATAGSGDVLGGMIAGFVAQFHREQPLERILAAAVFLHGYAGDLAVRRVGEMALTAGDILDCIPGSFLEIDGYHSPFLGS
ncbi:MAG: NAD(P)H-hydrate dehydratase [Candidatus Aminicenantes bacterium]|nr:NAD(P)H-hydrate dehydratase [Candidatus Aminicenantes bacterium]